MSAATAGLKRLHELHIRLQDLNKQLEHGPRQVKARQQILAKKQAEVDVLKAELKQTRMLADQKNLQLKTNESKIEQLRGKLNQAQSNREFDVIRSQIDADTMANSVLEDEILEVLEKVDQQQKKIKHIEEEAAQSAAEVRRVGQEIETAAPKLRRRRPSCKPPCPRPRRFSPRRRLSPTAGWCRPTGPGHWRRWKTTPVRPASRSCRPITWSSSTPANSCFAAPAGACSIARKPTDWPGRQRGVLRFVNMRRAMFPADNTARTAPAARHFLCAALNSARIGT